jgi:hypothetical protein
VGCALLGIARHPDEIAIRITRSPSGDVIAMILGDIIGLITGLAVGAGVAYAASRLI